ncbi:MAG: hypothetical protein Q4C60_07750 [Eubacteriales bacterium]|nr:hypothetical protein [Eubacteriales bacterium]
MVEWIKQYWLEALFTGAIGLLGWWCKRLAKAIKQKRAEEDAVKDGVLAILHDRLYTLANEYILAGQITLMQLKNLEYIYKSYSALGGNGTGTELWERCKDLPIAKEAAK